MGLIKRSVFSLAGITKIFLWLGVWHGVYFFLKKPTRLLWLVLTLPFIISGIGFLWELHGAYSEDEVMSSSAHQEEVIATGQGGLPVVIEGGGSPSEKKGTPPVVNQLQDIMKQSSNVKTLPPFVGKVEDGASIFNVSIAKSMQGNDYPLYASHFRYAMTHFPANEYYKWMIRPTFYGYFKANEPFKAKSGVMCRRFEEVTSYNGVNQRFKGYACPRGDGGWCKLRGTSSLSCGIGTSSPTSIFWRNTVSGLFSWW